jgi:hypothetical protein
MLAKADIQLLHTYGKFYMLNRKFNFLLQEAGVEIDPYGDLNTESERKLGQLVLEK